MTPPAAPAPPDPGAAGDVVPLPAAERGTTTLAPRVVEKIAAQAATEIGQVSGLARRIAGRTVGAERVRAEASLDGQVATVRLQIAVGFPAPLAGLTRQVRQHVTDQVQRMSGVRVDHIDITVAALRAASGGRRRVQ